MSPAQMDQIPDSLLRQSGTGQLREWLYSRGWRMTLLELDQERARRGVRPR